MMDLLGFLALVPAAVLLEPPADGRLIDGSFGSPQ
jgi:hypothetical protein